MGILEERLELFESGSEFAPVRREEIVGIDGTLDRLDAIIFWLRNHDKNIRIEPGVLFQGSPGTGKTLCARYVATQSQARFVNIRDWPLYTDQVSVHDIKDLFSIARDHYKKTRSPIILFWDEFENYAQDRTVSSGRNAAIVAQLTAELDGVLGKSPGLLMIGCTNYRENIDPALIRAGRMGLHLQFRAPDRAGKESLLSHYLSKYPCSGVDVESASHLLTEDTPAAAIEEEVNRIWLNTVLESVKMRKDPIITNKVVTDTLVDNLIGPPPSFSNRSEKEDLRIAVHELGHALVARALGVRVRLVTIRVGNDLGKTMTVFPDENLQSIDDLANQAKIGLGSIQAEKVAGVSVTANSSRDLYHSTYIANKLVSTHGVAVRDNHADLLAGSPVDFMAYDVKARSVENPMSETLKTVFDKRLVALLHSYRKETEGIIVEIGATNINALAKMLVKDITWTGKEFEEKCQEMKIR